MTFDPTQHPRDARGRWITVEGLPQGAKITDRAVNEALQRGMLKMSVKPANELEKGAFMLSIKPVTPPGVETAPRYVTREDDDRQIYYDPRFGHIETINPEEPSIARHIAQPNDGLQTEITPLPDKDIIYRGISAEEWESIQKTGQVLSTGDYNIGDAQKGLTYWTTDVGTAAHYANGFMPWQFKPTFEAPAYVIATRMPAEVRNVAGTGEHEVGVARPIRKDELVGVWRGDVYGFDPGSVQLRPKDNDEFRTGGGTMPSADVVWSRQDLPPEPEPEPTPKLEGSVPIIIREKGQDTVSTTIDTIARPGHVYVGMNEADYNASIGKGLGIKLSIDSAKPAAAGNGWSLPSQAENSINSGLGDPRARSVANFLVEVEVGNGSGMRGVPGEKDQSELFDIENDRVSRVLIMGGDGAGRIQGHLFYDKDAAGPLKSSLEINRELLQSKLTPIVEALGFDPNKIMATNEVYEFVLNGTKRFASGTADLTTGNIKIYAAHYGGDDHLPQLVAHEVMHQKFQAFLNDYNAERDAAMKEIHEWDAANPHAGRLDEPMKVDGTLREPWASKYPLYQAYTELNRDGWNWTGPTQTNRMIQEDGCTQYSREWWEAFKNGSAQMDQAYHETLAEMAALRATTEKEKEYAKDQVVGSTAEIERIDKELKDFDEAPEEDKPYRLHIRILQDRLGMMSRNPTVTADARAKAQAELTDLQRKQTNERAAHREALVSERNAHVERIKYFENRVKATGPMALLKNGKLSTKRQSELWNRLYKTVSDNWNKRHRYKKP